MRGAGEYADRLTWKKRTAVKNPANGEDEEVFTDSGLLWCAVEEGSGRKQTDYGAEQSGEETTVRIRNYPAVSALDRLFSGEWGELWIIEDIARGNNELVCRCHRYDELQP